MTDIGYVQSLASYYERFDAMYDLARILPMTRHEGVITAHVDSTSITDTYLPNENGLFNGGAIFVWYSIAGPPVTLGKEFGEVTDHTGTTIKYRYQSAFPDTGNNFAVFARAFPPWMLASSVGHALRDIGDIPVSHIITTIANQQEYTLADLNTAGPVAGAALQAWELIGVDIASGSSAPFDYVPHYHWQWKQQFTGGMSLIFDPGHIPTGGRRMRLTYRIPNQDFDGQYAKVNYLINTYWEGKIAPVINTERLAWQAAVYALRWKVSEAPSEPKYATMLNEAIKRAETYAMKYPVQTPAHIHQAAWLTGR